jgi:hypothetical protein
MAFFQSQNEKIQNGSIDDPNARYIHLDTLGLTNACVDSKIEAPFYLEFAVNNTYGVQTIPQEIYLDAKDNLTKEGGCNDLVDQCRALASFDTDNTGTNETVNAACALATQYCFQFVQGAFTQASNVRAISASRHNTSNMTSGVLSIYHASRTQSFHPRISSVT